MEIDFQSHDVPTNLPSEISLCLIRVLQEALHNAAKHSGVRQFDVRLWGTLGDAHLILSDCGKGFDAAAARKGPGLGLTSMRERLKMVDGDIVIESRPGVGTSIHARVPVGRKMTAAGAGG